MGKNVLIISSSLRKNSNSERLAKQFAKGAEDEGNKVEFVSLADKKIAFCRGCMACQKTKKCVIGDDAIAIAEKMLTADVIAFATPVYYYEMSGQLKTMLDRANSLYCSDYAFRDIYVLTTAADDDEHAPDRAVSGICGWIDCFEKAEFKGSVFCGGVDAAGEIEGNAKLSEAYELGRTV